MCLKLHVQIHHSCVILNMFCYAAGKFKCCFTVGHILINQAVAARYNLVHVFILINSKYMKNIKMNVDFCI